MKGELACCHIPVSGYMVRQPDGSFALDPERSTYADIPADKTDWGKRTALVEEFCDCCSVSFPDKPKVSPQSPLAFAFFSFVSGVECGQSQAADSETE